MKQILIWSVSKFFSIIYILMFVRIALSWVRVSPYNKVVNTIYQITDPILEPFKRLIDRFGLNTGMIDFSPLIAYLVLQFVEKLIIRTLWLI
ncbi:MAG: YggT family protein [Lutispora sp.]|nr:YggT family protein [Lutispora sp.]MDD4834058.1 YggT family protein [Lutispora sp.]